MLYWCGICKGAGFAGRLSAGINGSVESVKKGKKKNESNKVNDFFKLQTMYISING